MSLSTISKREYGKIVENAIPQARALYPSASHIEVWSDLADIAGRAAEVAEKEFPHDRVAQMKWIEAEVANALQRALGSLSDRTVH